MKPNTLSSVYHNTTGQEVRFVDLPGFEGVLIQIRMRDGYLQSEMKLTTDKALSVRQGFLDDGRWSA